MDKKPELKKPVFSKIRDIRPGQHCYHIYGKVIKSTPGTITRISGDEVQIVDGIIADESGSAAFHFEGENNIATVPVGAIVAIRNGRCEVVDEHIRFEVDKFGKVTTESADKVKTANTADKDNISNVPYERKPSARNRN